MKKLLTFILSITLSTAVWSQDEKICPVGEFHSVVAGSTMELALQESSQPSVKIIADKALMPYIQVYVRSRVLYVDMDEKSIPSDVRKLYKGKNAPVPVTRVLVSASGTGSALITSYGGVVADTLTLSDKSVARDILLRVPSPRVIMDRSAQATLSYSGEVISLELSGNADCTLSGETGTLSFRSERKARLNSLSCNSRRVKADMKGSSEACVHAEEFLFVNLTGGSALYYTGIPAITVDQILKSTFAPYEK